MTTREIAEATGKDERTIQRWAKATGDKMSSISDKVTAVNKTGRPADYDIDESCAIIEHGMGKNAASLYRENARNQRAVSIPAESALSAKDVALIAQIVAATVAETIKQLDGRMGNIESQINQRKALLPAPQIKPRDHVSMLVRSHATRSNISYQEAWGELYTEFAYRTNSNPRTSARNRNMAIIDYIEAEGMIETLEAIAIDTMGK